MRFLPLIIVAVLIVIALVLRARARQRSADLEARMRRDITAGTQVMTTSGLYATVVAINSDDTVILAIAPGVEVRWAFAALRHAETLPPRYRRSTSSPAEIDARSAPVGNPGGERGVRNDAPERP